MARRPWISLYEYENRFGYPLAYRVPDNRPHERTCKWCHRELLGKCNRTFCSDDCAKAWQSRYVWNRKRAPVPWRIMCRDNFTCQDCGFMSVFTNEHGIEHPTPDGLEVHHVIFVEHGGSDHESNLVTLCKECHLERHGKMSAEKRRAVSPQLSLF